LEEKALQEIQNNAGRLHDENAVEACIKIINENKASFQGALIQRANEEQKPIK